MIFKPGDYYIGDPGFVLSSDDLRMLFTQIMQGTVEPGARGLVSAVHEKNVDVFYWFALTPHKSGTLYDQNGKGWGFDWGCFGVVPWEWVQTPESYLDNKVQFQQEFECFSHEDGIKIGHLNFTFNSK